jgi:phosphoribosyl-ATP pyrophosphohydrolase/phosphoribosyl-AMP cyclohydrolase
MIELTAEQQEFLSACNFDKGNGVVSVIAQDASSKDVLMMAFADSEAVTKMLETSQMWYLSRERGLWHKGDTSGNYQNVVSLHLDCDRDTILAVVTPEGPACHRGSVTCFVDTPSITGETRDQ